MQYWEIHILQLLILWGTKLTVQSLDSIKILLLYLGSIADARTLEFRIAEFYHGIKGSDHDEIDYAGRFFLRGIIFCWITIVTYILIFEQIIYRR